MQGYGNYGNPNGIGGMPGNRGFAVPNGINGAGGVVNTGNVGGVGINPGTYNWGYPANSYNQVPMQQDGRRYVTGRAGADAYQMQPGESEVILWDDDARRFYIKGYDEKGRPRVLETMIIVPMSILRLRRTTWTCLTTLRKMTSRQLWLTHSRKSNLLI